MTAATSIRATRSATLASTARVMTLHSKVFIVSNRPIRAGEELFWDYDSDQERTGRIGEDPRKM